MRIELEGYTKYERARLIGSRALQISMGAPILVKLSDEELQRMRYNPVEIAKLELAQGLIPIDVKRPMPERKKAAEKQA